MFAFAPTVQAQQRPAVEPAIEFRLDQLLNNANTVADAVTELEAIADSLSERTPVMSRVRTLSYLSMYQAYNGKMTEAYAIHAQVAELAAQSGIPDAIAEAAANHIELKLIERKLTEAYTLLNEAIVPLQDATLPRVRYYIHNLVARVFSNKSQYERALEHLIQAADAVDETDDSRTHIRRIHIKLRIAELQTQLKNYEEAIRHADEALAQAESLQLADIFYGEILLQKAITETERGNYEEALTVYQQLADRYADDEDNRDLYGIILNNMADLDIRTGRYDDAEALLNQALLLAEPQKDEIATELLKFNLGFVDVHQGEHEQGLNTMKAAVDHFRDTWIDSEFEGVLGEYAEALGMAGKYEQQAQILLEQRDLRDKVFSLELQKNLTELQNLYDNKDKAQQIKLLQQQNDLKQQLLKNEEQRQLILTLLVILALIAGVLVYFLYRAARKSNLKLKDANAMLADQSIRDPLTGLLNRRAIQQELERQKREQGQRKREDAMILLDIDYFKRINDHYGHTAGDAVLVEIARRLIEVSRESDKVVRWGGEEFLIYLSNAEHDALPRLTQRVLDVIGTEPVSHEDHSIPVTATAGFISFPFADLDNNEMDWEETLQLADLALYAGKVYGRNQAWGVMELNQPFAQARKRLENDLPGAIGENIISVTTIHGPKQG
ncbi:tetratricopeptide repeat-containing diguanylate cyclase [Pseudidiomarina sp.]|uniref:tetratricopeptide repeat-containing diguanylate cyclase n=1 Tax=Pseudidiomarina sp. TaxID=2081707 RepID=UPI00299E0E54|nr:tetratricopeptide repeat-containing diguanylate cyclase [Pseudidiomarina sp.]